MFRIYAAIVLMLGAGLAYAAPTDNDTIWPVNPNNGAITLFAEDCFDDPGTNLKFTEVSYGQNSSYLRHTASTGITSLGRLTLDFKSSTVLNALDSPPSSNPFIIKITADVSNDEGEEAEGTVEIRVTY